jgi:phage terminase large subunit
MKNKSLLKAYLRRNQSKVEFLDPNFLEQNNFILDPSRRKAVQCTRRAGKSRGVGNYLCKVAQDNPGVSLCYIALTSGSAKRIMFKDILKVINREKKANLKFNEVELTVKFPNGSVIYLAGGDAKPDEIEKQLGQKFKLVVFDECGSFRQDLRKMVEEVIWPAMTDLEGTVVLIGTPRSNTKSYFHDVTTGKVPGWSVHKWSALRNPYVAVEFKNDMDALIKANPRVVDTPMFKQMYLGEWAVDDDARVYKFTETRNICQGLPTLQGRAQWYYVLGVDLGFSPDPSAFVLCAYNEHDKNLYIVDTFKKTEMDLTSVANKIKHYQKYYPVHKVIVDNAAKQAVEEIKHRHGLQLVAAEKTHKVDFIETMNDDFIQGNIKVLQSCIDSAETDESIADEWQTLVWDEKALLKGKKEENSACANHLTDAALYAWRYCYNYLGQKHEPKPLAHTKDAVEEFFKQEAERMQKPQREWWDKDWE